MKKRILLLGLVTIFTLSSVVMAAPEDMHYRPRTVDPNPTVQGQ